SGIRICRRHDTLRAQDRNYEGGAPSIVSDLWVGRPGFLFDLARPLFWLHLGGSARDIVTLRVRTRLRRGFEQKIRFLEGDGLLTAAPAHQDPPNHQSKRLEASAPDRLGHANSSPR